MTWTRAAADVLDARRAAYERLKAAGLSDAPCALPPASPLDLPLVDAQRREVVTGGWNTQFRLRAGEFMRLTTPRGDAAAALVAWSTADPSERLNYADTVKLQWTSRLQKGRVIFSDMGRVMLSIVEDSSGGHDALMGGTGPGTGGRNTRDNLIVAAGKLGLSSRDIPPLVTFFAPVAVDADGRFVWHPTRRAGEFVEMRAEMDLLVALSNCRHPLDPDPVVPGPLEVAVGQAHVAEDDFCRTATTEARRGFENNAAAA